MNTPADLRSQIGILSVEEVSLILDVSEHTLYIWRSKGEGPKFVKLGRGVFYRHADLQEWIDSNVVTKDVG